MKPYIVYGPESMRQFVRTCVLYVELSPCVRTAVLYVEPCVRTAVLYVELSPCVRTAVL